MLNFARLLLTLAALQYSVAPLLVDLSPSHVFHADWPPHARFHMTWQLTIICGCALYVLALLWLPLGNLANRLRYACVPGFIVLGGFFVTAASMSLFGGALADPNHQVLILGLDGNLFAFSIALTLQVVGTLLIWQQTAHTD